MDVRGTVLIRVYAFSAPSYHENAANAVLEYALKYCSVAQKCRKRRTKLLPDARNHATLTSSGVVTLANI